MKAKYYKARIWEIEWENHIIRAESSENVVCPYRLSVDDKLVAKAVVWNRTLRGKIHEDGKESRYLECFFNKRYDWLRELRILRRKERLFNKMLCYIRDESFLLEQIEIHIEIDGEAIYNSVFGTQEKIQEVNEILKDL